MKKFIIVAIAFSSCQFDPSKRDGALKAEGLNSTQVEQINEKEPLFTEAELKEIENQRKTDSIRLASFKIKTLKIDDQITKCNLKKGEFLIQGFKDSTDLEFAAQQLASVLLTSVRKNASCSYPVMSAAYIYISQKQYDDEVGPAAGATITPSGSQAYINPFVWEMYKKKIKHGNKY